MKEKLKVTEARLLSVKEACERLGIAHWTFYQLVHRHAIKTVKIGKRRLVSTHAIDQFVENSEQYGA